MVRAQPRRIGATSLAQYVAELCECQLGQEVGYRIGGSTEVHPHRTCLVYQTTAIAMIQFLRGVGARRNYSLERRVDASRIGNMG